MAGGVLQREPTGPHEQQPQRAPQRAVDTQELVGDGVHQEVAQRERLRFQHTLAAPRAIRTGQWRVARHAPFNAGRLGTDTCGHSAAGGC
jgi:hypothetical protein